ncbi:Uncharacterised protein [uncultured archaeon]|nr:Uncharacterised protein [uncultured archaeon]
MKKRSILRIASVQIQYELEHPGLIWKIIWDESYTTKIFQILEFLKGKVDCIVFPELSIPFEMIGELKKYVDTEKIMIIAGSHYIESKNVEHYEQLFDWKFNVEDVRKSICPILVPDRSIFHIEKINPSVGEEIGYADVKFNNGELQGIFSVRDYYMGILICSDFLSPDIRSRILQNVNLALVPQFNSEMKRFYRLADSEFNNPNNVLKVILLANATGETAKGGSALFMNLGASHQKVSKESFGYDYATLITSKEEELILLFKINMESISGRTPNVWKPESHPVDYQEIPIIKKEKGILEIINGIQDAEDVHSCAEILNDKRNQEIIRINSQILFNKIDINNLNLEEIKERIQAVLV